MCIVAAVRTLEPLDNATLQDVSKFHKWIRGRVVLMFWGDNVNEQWHVQDLWSNNHGETLHMFNMITGQSNTKAQEMSFAAQIAQLNDSYTNHVWLMLLQ